MPRYPMNESQALIVTRLINKQRLRKSEINATDLVILTQVGAIKIIDGKLDVTNKGKLRFVKWAREQGMV